MKIMNRYAFALLFAIVAQAAGARDTFHDLSVEAALKSPSASGMRAIPIFMAGQDHPAAGESLETATSNRRTNAFGKSDEDACAIAFLSAIIALQDRATALGGSAVVDIKSITKAQRSHQCDRVSLRIGCADCERRADRNDRETRQSVECRPRTFPTPHSARTDSATQASAASMPSIAHDESDMTARKHAERALTSPLSTRGGTDAVRNVCAQRFCNRRRSFEFIDPDTSATGDRPTPAQTELMQGVNDRRHEAATEKADNQHQAEMKKCEGLVWEEAKLCKDQVSTETAQTQAKSRKIAKRRRPRPQHVNCSDAARRATGGNRSQRPAA